MNNKLCSFIEKKIIESSIISSKIKNKAFKYLSEEETIRHLSLVFYDILPLSLKLSLRYEKFYSIFAKHYSKLKFTIFKKQKLILNDDIEKK